MKKTTLFFFLVLIISQSLWAQNTSDSPRITIQKKRVKVKKLMAEITRQSSYQFSYNSRVIEPNKIIAFSVKNATLKQTLDQFSEKVNVRYTIIEDQIILNFPDKKDPPPAPVVTRPKDIFYTLAGFLSNGTTGESIIGGTVYAQGTSIGTFTNEFGYYSLALKPGEYDIIFSHIGYKRIISKVSIKKAERRNVSLTPTSFEIPTVVIKPPMAEILNQKQLGELQLTPNDMKRLPEYGGEPGIVNGLQSLPGIKTHSDGSAYFYTRGGAKDQNVIFIDDAPIFNPSHMFGFYSIFTPDFAKSIDVYKSDMPANMGDRLSSIISIRTKDGNLKKFEMNGAVNPFVNRISFETPIRKDKSSLFVTLRRSNFGWLYKRNNPGSTIQFGDLHLKWNRKLNDNNRLFFTAIYSNDLLQNIAGFGRTGINWTNAAATLRWNHVFNPKLFSNTTIYTGNYENRLFVTPNQWKSNLGTLSIKTDFTHYTRPALTSKFGVEFQGYFNDPGSISLDTTLGIFPSITPNYNRKTVFYYQGEWTPFTRLKANFGVRLINWANLGPTTYFSFDQDYQVNNVTTVGDGVYNFFVHADPRVSLQYQLDESSQIKLSYGRYHQYLQMVTNSISPFTSLEVWLPASTNIEPQVSRQWSLSYLRYLEEQQMELSAAIYHKNMDNQVDFDGHAVTYLNPLIEGELRIGTMRAYGIELLIKKNFGKLNGWIGYTYSRAIRQTRGLNNNLEYPAFQDRPHDFSLLLNYQKSPRVLYSLYWTSYSGSPFTSPTGFFTFNNQTLPVFGERHNDRLPAYHRGDLSVQWRLNKDESKRFQHNLTLSVNNVLGHRNVFTMKFNRIEGVNMQPAVKANVLSEETLRTTQIYLVRFFPSLTYRFKL